MRFLTVARDFLDPATFPIEMVERKGVGHPDSLADALANEISVVFSRHCLERFGLVLHHNLDKLYIGAVSSRPTSVHASGCSRLGCARTVACQTGLAMSELTLNRCREKRLTGIFSAYFLL